MPSFGKERQDGACARYEMCPRGRARQADREKYYFSWREPLLKDAEALCAVVANVADEKQMQTR